jgi:hypothetical protein
MSDYRDPDPRTPDVNPRVRDYDDRYAAAGSTPPWGWIAGAIFAFLVLAVIFSWSGSGSRTAGSSPTPPASTTGAAPPADPAPPVANAPPAQAPGTNGQGGAK